MISKLLPVNIVIVIITFLLFTYRIPFNYYLIPLILCGIISLTQLFSYFKNQNALREVFFYVWFIFFVASFIAPLIHFGRDYWKGYVNLSSSDWQGLAFYVSSIYLYGIIIFISLSKLKLKQKKVRHIWSFKSNAALIVSLLMVFSFVLQTYLYAKIGGIKAYIQIFTDKEEASSGFTGMGALFIVSEIFPYLLLLWYFIKKRGKNVSVSNVAIFLALMLVACIYFGGLRGSRSNTVFTMVHAVIVVHFTIFRFKRKHFMILLASFFLFMAIGRLYKNDGIEMIKNYKNYDDIQISNKMSSAESIIISDLARYDVRCFELFMLENNIHYKKKYGSTYLYSVLTFIPFGKSVRNSLHLTGRTEAAGQLQFDSSGVVKSNKRKNTRIFGFIGESMLNFGIFSFILAYIVLYFILAYISQWTNAVPTYDARFIIIAMISIFIPLIINADSNNVIFTIIKRPLPLYFILFFITTKKVHNIQTI